MPPLSDAEFHNYLNGQGQLTRPEELRLRIYHGGVEPSLRKVQHLRLTTVHIRKTLQQRWANWDPGATCGPMNCLIRPFIIIYPESKLIRLSA